MARRILQWGSPDRGAEQSWAGGGCDKDWVTGGTEPLLPATELWGISGKLSQRCLHWAQAGLSPGWAALRVVCVLELEKETSVGQSKGITEPERKWSQRLIIVLGEWCSSDKYEQVQRTALNKCSSGIVCHCIDHRERRRKEKKMSWATSAT